LEQSKQLLDVVHYLYDCHHVIHRKTCPKNVLLDYDTNHRRLIDFGLGMTYDIDDKAGNIEIMGTTIYAGLKLLDFCSKLMNEVYSPYYEYERTFDLQCALNITISMIDDDIKHKVHSIEILLDVHKKQLKILRFWKDI
jgi:serine/threonine protein kinase